MRLREFEKRDPLEASYAASIFGANMAVDEVLLFVYMHPKTFFKVEQALETKRKALAF